MAQIQKRGTPASKAAKPVTKEQTTAIAKRELLPVTFIAQDSPVVDEYELPKGMEGATEAPSSLTPTAQWTEPGEYVIGKYLGMQENVGPNNSRLYSLRVEGGELDGQIVSIWGTQVLDNRMDLLNPPKDALLTIIFVGESQAKKGQNPAKLFKVAYK